MIQVSLYTGHTWPLATCCAVADDTVLTTADAACDAAMFRKEKLAIHVVDPSSGTKFEVRAVRVPADYQMCAERPDERRFYNLGLLEVRGKLPKKLPLASGKELGELKVGLRLASFGFSPKRELIAASEPCEPGLTPARLFLVKSPPPHAVDGPRSLDLTAAFPENALGSPLIDAQGKIVAIYSAAALPADVGGINDLHFAVVASSKLLGSGCDSATRRPGQPSLLRKVLRNRRHGHELRPQAAPQPSQPAGRPRYGRRVLGGRRRGLPPRSCWRRELLADLLSPVNHNRFIQQDLWLQTPR